MSSAGRLGLSRIQVIPRLLSINPNIFCQAQCSIIPHSFSQARSGSSTPVETGIFKFGKMLDTNAVYKLDHYSKMNPTAISIKHLMDHGKQSSAAASFQFLRKEIPVRQANMIMELQHVSGEIKCQAEYQQIWQQYLQSFKEMISFENAANTPEVHLKFLDCLMEQRRRHADTVPQMATAVRGMLDMKDIRKHNHFKEHVQYILDRLYLNRISIHMLISNYQALHEKSIKGKNEGGTGMLGTVDPKCNIMEVVREAFSAAAFICDREYLDSPDLSLKGFENKDKDSGKMLDEKDSIKVAYVPAHLYHIFFEIFKNAMRATCEVCEERGLHELPYIKVRVYKTKDDVTICISDFGGGIPRTIVNNVFDYFFTTAGNQSDTEVRNVPVANATGGLESEVHPMHGLGYGLPLSRLYARYFQGDVRLASIDGFGTSVYVYLNAISEEAQERLPVYSSVAVKKLKDTAPKQHDWTSMDINPTKFPE